MIDLFKKTLLVGLGAATLTAEHVKGLVDDLQKQGKITREEAEKLAREMAVKTSEHVKIVAAELEEEGKLTREEIEKFAMEMASKTSEHIKTLAQELKAKGSLSKEDAEKFVKDASARAETVKVEVENRIKDLAEEVTKRLKLVNREEFDALAARVAALEEALKASKPAE